MSSNLKQVAMRVSVALPLVGIALVMVAAWVLPRGPLPHLAILTPIAYFVVVVADLSVVAVLMVTWRYAPVQRSTLALALTFGVTAALTFLSMLVLQLIPNAPPVIDGLQRVGILLFIGWHFAAAIGGLIYCFIRAKADAPATRHAIVVATASALCTTAALIGCAFLLESVLPPLASGAALRGLVTAGIGPLALVCLVIATILTFRVPAPSLLDRAFAYSLFALMLELGGFVFGGQRYSAGYYAGRMLLLLGSAFVLFSVLQTQLSSRMQLLQVEWKLALAETESSKRAGRIRALWQITSHSSQSNQERFNSILEVATSAIRPGKAVLGCLSYLENDTIVISALSWSSDTVMDSRVADVIYVGATFPLERTLQNLLYASGTTQAWNDLSELDSLDFIYREIGCRSLIGTPVPIGNRTHFLTFACTETMLDQPFAEDDLAYVDVVSAFFASRFSQELQFERMQFQIEHDALTGLKNRAQFRNAIRESIALGTPFTLAFLNLDAFGRINTEHGHLIGDEVLVEVATELDAIDKHNYVARMSADEFGILIRDTHDLSAASAAIETYRMRFRKPFQTGDRDGTRVLSIEASIGAARFPVDGSSAEELMKRADVALSQAKARGGSTSLIFDGAMELILEETHVRATEFAEALAGNQLALVYQPTFELATRTIVGAEALVRWDHPTRGRLLPAEFLPFVERSGQMTHLTRWVFRQVVHDIKKATLPPGFRAYFNLGTQTLDDFPFIAELNETLCATPGLVDHLGIEVTETVAMHNLESAMHTINLFRGWGITVAIDDFGTGYSSLAYLKELSVDTIKIDRSFVMDLPDDERGGVITDMLLRVTDRFGFVSLAEGIETERQLDWLIEHGCRLGQGYLISKPCPIADLLSMLDDAGQYALI